MNEATSSKPRGGNGASTDSPGDSHEGIVDKIKNTATAQLTNQKNRATDGLGSIASAVRQSTQQLRDQQHDVIAGYVDQAADQIEQLSQRLRSRDITDLFGDLQNLSRRQPALFVGGAFALGFVAARFLKSSGQDARSDWYENAGPRTTGRDMSGGEDRGYASAGGQTYPESPSASTVHDYSSPTSSFNSPSGSSFGGATAGSSFGGSSSSESIGGSDAAETDVNSPEAGGRKSRTRRTTQTERP